MRVVIHARCNCSVAGFWHLHLASVPCAYEVLSGSHRSGMACEARSNLVRGASLQPHR